MNYPTCTEQPFSQRVAEIRKLLKSMCPTFSVRRGPGTASSWVDVSGSRPNGYVSPAESHVLEELGAGTKANLWTIPAEESCQIIDLLRRKASEWADRRLDAHASALPQLADFHTHYPDLLED